MPAPANLVYLPDAVRAIDACAIGTHGIPGYELMGRAGAATLAAARARWPAARRWLVLCGAGNNAGDGYVIARLARAAGLPGMTSATSTPVASRAPKDLARSGVSGWMVTPSQPRDTLPLDTRSV